MARKRTRKSIKKAIWEICKAIVRIRDENKCQMCNKEVEGTDAQTSHVKNKGKYSFLEFDLLNLKLLCYHCHLNIWHKDPTFAGKWFEKKFPVRLRYLDDKIADRQERTKTIKEADLLQLESDLKQKLSEMKGNE